MGIIFPTIENIQRLKVQPTPGEAYLIEHLKNSLDDSYEIFFNPYLDGDRPDIIILHEHCAAFVIEVKDWDLASYRVSKENTWSVVANGKNSRIASPQSQLFRYKKNLYDLHLPVVGLRRLTNPNFFNLVHCFAFLFGSNQQDIENLYKLAEVAQRDAQKELNAARQQNRLGHDDYEHKMAILDRRKHALQRDKAMAFGSDRLNILTKKIRQNSKHPLFDEDVYQDFKRRLSPPEHTLKQGVTLRLDSKQSRLSKSNPVMEKVKGVAGCGKTTILAQRAIDAANRHSDTVLILV